MWYRDARVQRFGEFEQRRITTPAATVAGIGFEQWVYYLLQLVLLTASALTDSVAHTRASSGEQEKSQ